MGQSDSKPIQGSPPQDPQAIKEHQRRLKCAENISLKLGVPTVEIVSLCEFIRKNGFEILDFLLGKGGQALVYHGQSLINSEQVAVKLVKKPNKTQSTSLQKEFSLLRALRSQHVVRAYESLHFESEHSSIFITIMERCQSDLASYLRTRVLNGTKAEIQEKIYTLCLQLAKGLKDIHARNILHLDIKPSNIMLGKDNNWKFIDLSLAVPLNSTNKSIQKLGMTELYASPEQFQSWNNSSQNKNTNFPKEISKGSDIYSLGLVYLLLTGAYVSEKSLFAMKTLGCQNEISQDNNQLERFIQFNDDIFSGLNSKVISKMLSYEQTRRPEIESVERTLSALLFQAQFDRQQENKLYKQEQSQQSLFVVPSLGQQSINTSSNQIDYERRNSQFSTSSLQNQQQQQQYIYTDYELNKQDSIPYRNSEYIPANTLMKPNNTYINNTSTMTTTANNSRDTNNYLIQAQYRNSEYIQRQNLPISRNINYEIKNLVTNQDNFQGGNNFNVKELCCNQPQMQFQQSSSMRNNMKQQKQQQFYEPTLIKS